MTERKEMNKKINSKRKLKFNNIKPVFELPSVFLRNLIGDKIKYKKCCYCCCSDNTKEKLISISKTKINEEEINLNVDNSTNSLSVHSIQSDSGNESASSSLSSASCSITNLFIENDSDDEDDFFYDANDSFQHDTDDYLDISQQSIISTDSYSIVEFDQEDIDMNDDELDMSKEKSVVTYVLSQLKIGMDLDSVSLPSFILESRSLLELYAEYYMFTDLFLQIPNGKTPYERMILVVKWYMSSFRAKLVAKKPYNPILGEVFQCLFDTNSNDTSNELVRDGPLPWANKNQLTFVAEQVSHHPPISAFYLEHYNKKIQLNGHIESRSKFLGLSVAVESIGKGVISLLDHQEEYEITYPTACVRSILTMPWLEMTGLITIKCVKTGYSSQINFFSKPFYGGKKHQLEGTIYGPNMSVVNRMDGTWSENVYIKSDLKNENLIDTDALVKYKKKVRKIEDQAENESRKIWQDVTTNLRNNKNELATKAKNIVEQKQRDDAKLRKENNIEWNTKYFHLVNDDWVFNNPLRNRLYQN